MGDVVSLSAFLSHQPVRGPRHYGRCSFPPLASSRAQFSRGCRALCAAQGQIYHGPALPGQGAGRTPAAAGRAQPRAGGSDCPGHGAGSAACPGALPALLAPGRAGSAGPCLAWARLLRRHQALTQLVAGACGSGDGQLGHCPPERGTVQETQLEEKLGEGDLRSLDVHLRSNEQSSAFCLPRHWLQIVQEALPQEKVEEAHVWR
ncbi:uncharacterized protein [Emydura macquarii macquarii]|uniref:uncharacterized protein n=1 Tax=Emydura macquarii macquarii TaxID=1129001 RepID=UPI00352B88EE